MLKIEHLKKSYENFSLDCSLEVKKGHVTGLIGQNGAGKSTLLKILAGVLKPSAGKVLVNGNVAPLIEVGAGFDPELTAKENIFLNGAILGHSRKFLQEHFNEIIEFAELSRFINVPVKNFSSGMYARLGFAIATVTNPDILIVDEVLSVGDYLFQEKCERRIQEMITKGTTIILVSHDITLIERVCTKVLWIDKGMKKDFGETLKLCNEYKNHR